MVKLLNSLYLGAAKPEDYGKAAGVVELLPFDYYLGAAVPGGGRPSFIDVVLSGVSPLTLLNAHSLNYLKAFGGTEQNGTPTPDAPVDIVCNNGTIKVSPNLFDENNIEGNFLLTDLGQRGNSATTFFLTGFIKVTPNTEYCFDFISGLDTQYRRICGYSSDSYNSFTELLVKKARPTDAGTRYTITFTTSATTNYIKISSVVSDTNRQILQGSTATPYKPYGEIYTDGTVETINVHGKNLWNGGDITTERVRAGVWERYSVQNDIGNGDWSCKHCTNIPAGTWTISFAGNAFRAVTYDGTSAVIYTILDAPCKSVTVTLPVKGEIWLFGSNASSAATIADVMVEAGTTATTYEPYYNGGTATAEMLLKVGDYQDVQSILNGAVTRNVGIKVLDGTENWGTVTNKRGYYITTDCVQAYYTNVTGFCSHFNYYLWADNVVPMPNNSLGFNKESISGITNGNITLKPDLTVYDTLDKFKQFLADQYAAGTPVIIVYPLATPTTESVTPQTVTVQEGTNIVEITQASMSGLTMEVGYKSYVRVTIQEIEAVNTDSNVTVIIS